jgi:hypothetical protein
MGKLSLPPLEWIHSVSKGSCGPNNRIKGMVEHICKQAVVTKSGTIPIDPTRKPPITAL